MDRDAILAEGEQARAAMLALDADSWAGRPVDEAALSAARDRFLAQCDRYRQWLPEVPVARDPETGELVRWPIDTVDLNGWFWEYQDPVRRPARRPADWLAMAGAMRIGGTVTPAPFVARPGPEVPYVVPRILSQPGIRAVVTQLPVGQHTGWPVTYFGTRPRDVPLVNLWGTNSYPVVDNGEWLGWDEVPEWSPDNDYGLGPWLESGKLLWIAPGDESMTLRRGTDGCPYLGLSGNHEYAIVEGGTVRYPAPPPESLRRVRQG